MKCDPRRSLPAAALRREQWQALAKRPGILVLDVEARGDTVARKLARRTQGSPSLLLREITSVSCLRLHAGCHAAWQLETFHREHDLDEAQLLAAVDREVRSAAAEGAVLVTYNGLEHDLPLLRSRQVRWWQCHHDGLLTYLDGVHPHVDVMRELPRGGSRYARLTDACASLGVSLFGPSRFEADREVPIEQEKGELDVVGTALLYFFLLADRLANRELLLERLDSLAAFLARQAVFRPHLKALAINPLFALAQKQPEQPKLIPVLGV